MHRTALILLMVSVFLFAAATLSAQEVKPLFTNRERIPADAVVLFDGKNASEWVKQGTDQPIGWKIENGYMEVVPGTGDICTKKEFGDCQLHIQFWLPLMADAQGQARANSGVYIQNRYEIQVLDSYKLKSDMGDCGAIYGVAAPLVNACRPPEHWQSYDIIFRAPKYDKDGKVVSHARMTVLHNGILIHDNVEIPGPTTAAGITAAGQVGPIKLQDHGCKVRYRNIWIRPL